MRHLSSVYVQLLAASPYIMANNDKPPFWLPSGAHIVDYPRLPWDHHDGADEQSRVFMAHHSRPGTQVALATSLTPAGCLAMRVWT